MNGPRSGWLAGAVLAQRLLDPAPDTTVTAQPWRPTPPPRPLALAVDAVVSRLAAVATALRHLPNAPRGPSALPAATPPPPAPPSPVPRRSRPWTIRSGPAGSWP